MTHVFLGLCLVRRDGALLLVRSSYPSAPQPLWGLPGGRAERGELLADAALRELAEETSLTGSIVDLAYTAESFDGKRHFVACVYEIEASGEIAIPPDDHVVDVAWVPLARVREHLLVPVVREPLLAFLERGTRYTGFGRLDETIRWYDEPR